MYVCVLRSIVFRSHAANSPGAKLRVRRRSSTYFFSSATLASSGVTGVFTAGGGDDVRAMFFMSHGTASPTRKFRRISRQDQICSQATHPSRMPSHSTWHTVVMPHTFTLLEHWWG